MAENKTETAGTLSDKISVANSALNTGGVYGIILLIVSYGPSIIRTIGEIGSDARAAVVAIKTESDAAIKAFKAESDAKYDAAMVRQDVRYAEIAATLKAAAEAARAARDEAKATRAKSEQIGTDLLRNVAKVQKSFEASDGGSR